jgi:penicillin-binding protein 1B
VGNGEVVAIVGGRQSTRSGFNRALDAVRPVGSLIKPAVYLAALTRDRYTLATLIDDSPIKMESEGGKPDWQPRNYDRKNHGVIPLLEALTQSYNQATVRLGQELGIKSVVDTIKKLGVSRRQPEVPSLFLGTGEMTPLEVTAMYHTLASGGFRTPLRAIREVVSSSGKLSTRFPFDVKQMFESDSIYLINHSLREVFRIGTASTANKYGDMSNMAGKTGTTNKNRDSWFAGYSDQLLAVVWLGNDDNTTTMLTGSSGALRVWSKLMLEIANKRATPHPPSNIVSLWIDLKTGEQTSPHCGGAAIVPFKKGTEPDSMRKCADQKKRDNFKDQEIDLP